MYIILYLYNFNHLIITNFIHFFFTYLRFNFIAILYVRRCVYNVQEAFILKGNHFIRFIISHIIFKENFIISNFQYHFFFLNYLKHCPLIYTIIILLSQKTEWKIQSCLVSLVTESGKFEISLNKSEEKLQYIITWFN